MHGIAYMASIHVSTICILRQHNPSLSFFTLNEQTSGKYKALFPLVLLLKALSPCPILKPICICKIKNRQKCASSTLISMGPIIFSATFSTHFVLSLLFYVSLSLLPSVHVLVCACTILW